MCAARAGTAWYCLEKGVKGEKCICEDVGGRVSENGRLLETNNKREG
jgi:hypothetical protein